MRQTEFTIRNGETVKVFVNFLGPPFQKGFEIWVVADVAGSPTLIDHLLTHHHVEFHLTYARSGDLIWRTATKTDIPSLHAKWIPDHTAAVARGAYRDTRDIINIVGSFVYLPIRRKHWNQAKKLLPGRWSDGIATLDIRLDGSVHVICPDAPSHPLHRSKRADTWNASSWRLWLMNSAKNEGERTSILNVSARELHLTSGGRDTVAHILTREQ